MSALSLRDYQVAILDDLRNGFRAGHRVQMLYAPTGAGKSLRKGTLVVMADGTLKAIEDVCVGDKLLGPDGGVRNVLALGRGREAMYEVRPVKGDPYYVNESHILSLRSTESRSILNVPLIDYLCWSILLQSLYSGWRVPGVLSGDFTPELVSLESVTKLGIEDYYGVVLDGDHLFLLGDFTVTHNTELAVSLLKATSEKGNRGAMILDRIVLCNQTSARLSKYGVDHGVMQAGHWRWRPYERVQVCSAQTLEKRGALPGMSLLIVDEAHDMRKQTIEFIKNNESIRVVGLSATPFSDGLGNIYTNVVSSTTTAKLVESKNLVPLRVFIAKEVDMTGAKKVAGEWSIDTAGERGIKITGDVVAEWAAKTMQIYGRPVKTIVFCANVAHGADLAQKFAEAGYNFVAISYKDSDEYKADVMADFSKPDTAINGIIACSILTKGYDEPSVLMGISARPYSKSFKAHVQEMGRVMRPYPDKDFAVWLDFSGNYLRFQEDWDELYHEGVSELKDGREKAKKEKTAEEKKQAKCPACNALWVGNGDRCVSCGFVRPFTNLVKVAAGEMEELSGSAVSRKEKLRWYDELRAILRTRGRDDGAVAMIYKEKFGAYPPWDWRNRPLHQGEVGRDVAGYEHSRRIAFAKGKAKSQFRKAA